MEALKEVAIQSYEDQILDAGWMLARNRKRLF